MPKRPLIAITLFVILGIVLGSFAPFTIWGLLAVCLVSAVFAAFTRRKVWMIASAVGVTTLLGLVLFLAHNQLSGDDVSRLPVAFLSLRGTVDSDVEIINRTNSTEPSLAQFVLRVRESAVSNESEGIIAQRLPVSGRVLVHLSLKSPITNEVLPAVKFPSYGESLSVHGKFEGLQGPRNPEGFDYRDYYGKLGITSLVSVRRPEEMQSLGEFSLETNPALRLLYPLRRKLLLIPKSYLPPTEVAVLNGILWGEKVELSGKLHDAFNRTGTIHILATAGLHVGMLTLLLRRLLKVLRLPNQTAIVTLIGLLICYSALSGGRPSVCRAVLVACFYLFGQLIGREPRMINALSFAALTLLLIEPRNLFDAGFQLSFATTFTITLLMPLFQSALQRRFPILMKSGVPVEMSFSELGKRVLREGVQIALLTLTAQIGSAPLIVFRSHLITLVSVGANLAVVPIVFLILVVGFPAVFIALLSAQLVSPLFALLHQLIALILKLILFGSDLPMAVLSVEAFPFWVVFLIYGGLWGVALHFRRKSRASN